MMNVLDESRGSAVFLHLGGALARIARCGDRIERECFAKDIDQRPVPRKEYRVLVAVGALPGGR